MVKIGALKNLVFGLCYKTHKSNPKEKVMKKQLLTIAFACAFSAANAAITIVDEDFSGLPLGEELSNASWWGPSWNSGDVAYTIANADGPEGVVAVTKTTEVYAGRFYGGGLRDQIKSMPDLSGTDVTPADIQISFWVKGTSTENRGQVGFSILSFDTTGESAVETGAGYYNVPIAPEAWTQVSFTMADMRAGIPGHKTDGTAFDLSSDSYQVFFWTRNEFETGWPTQENEGHIWSFSIAELSVVADVEGTLDPTYGGYPVVDGWINTESFMGWLYVGYAPWLFASSLDKYIYLPEADLTESGSWIYISK